MRILLDAHVSGRHVGPRLRHRGYDVRAIDREPELEGLADEQLLELARVENRILVTFEKRHFPDIVRRWAAGGRTHAGVVLVLGLRHDHTRLLLRAIEQAFERYPEQRSWRNMTVFLSPGGLDKGGR